MFKKKSGIVILYWILCFYQDTLMYKDRVRIAENIFAIYALLPWEHGNLQWENSKQHN